ncbi:MAG TPA: PEPxxWA-CTERM sorting domain-containing protein [Caulobacteraceae bacterium]|nr:PEPxxWA-CTERM sorting domain-containing protein [Caulobacteraceae bacterium]
MIGSASIAQAANLVSDGDFSNPSGGGGFVTYTGGTLIGPWTVTGASVDLIGGYWQSPTLGGGSVDLDGNAPGGVSQALTLGPGAYSLSFYLSANPDGGPPTKTVDVSVGSLLNDPFSYTIGSNSHGNMMYTLETVNFTTSGPTTLQFASADVGTPYGPTIGGVSVTAIPEPATWAMMLLGVGAMGAGLRMSRRTQLRIA